ncbi:MAG TPA: type II toxin-antitoxin system death-on-curing family toxin, partial [Deltaproteobacteria bacterium]|nr:type II toxin-antitoxin system death-on-curing family toxin [Deltaproteobacteria bacterium]
IHGIRDRGLLEPAISQPQQSAFGEDIFQDVPSKAAAYAFYLSENQPFLDGNKRIATAAALTFLRLNGFEILISDQE